MNPRLTHPHFGLDYAWGRVSPRAHHTAGSTFAARYLSPDASKNLSPREARDLANGGVDVVAVWESTANRSLDGYNAGAADAHAAQAQARACGMPEGRPIYFAVDFDAAGSEDRVEPYFAGVARILGKELCGPYGGYAIVKYLLDRGYGYAWQTYAWSGGQLDERAQLYQYSNSHRVAGVDCDFNKGLNADFGQFHYKSAHPAVRPGRRQGRPKRRVVPWHSPVWGTPGPQPSKKPVRKVTAATLGAGVLGAIVAAANSAGVHITPEEASALSTLAALIAGYLTKGVK